MSIIGSNILAGVSGQATGYNINNSVRLRNSATAYFNRTNSASAPTNNKIGTISCWVKRGALGSGTGNNQYIMETGTGTSDSTFFHFLINKKR